MKTVRILVVEDNEDHLFLTVRALRDLDDAAVEIETVSDGEQALDFMKRRNAYADRPLPHLVLLDIKMPKVDGLEVLEAVKNDPELRKIPVIVLTSSDRPEDVERTYGLGGNSFVTKPTTASGLREGLRRLGHFWAGVAVLPEVNGAH